jgi:hypothetical protein
MKSAREYLDLANTSVATGDDDGWRENMRLWAIATRERLASLHARVDELSDEDLERLELPETIERHD